MALEQITFNIGAFNDSDAGGNNYFTNTVFEVKNQSDNTFAAIYADSSGTTQIPQNGIDNVSNSRGECNFYIDEGEFYIEVDGNKKNFKTKKDASAITTDSGASVQEYIDGQQFESIDAVKSYANLSALIGYRIQTKEYHAGTGYGGASYDVVASSSVTPNDIDIIQGVADGTAAVALRTYPNMEVLGGGSSRSGSRNSLVISRLWQVVQSLTVSPALKGGHVYLGYGYYEFDEPIIQPEKINVYGNGRGATWVIPSSSFSGSYLWRAGEASNTAVTNCEISDIAIDAESVSGLIAYYSNSINEHSGINNCLIKSQSTTAILIDTQNSGAPNNFYIKDTEAYVSNSNNSVKCIDINIPGFQFREVYNVTVIGDKFLGTTPAERSGDGLSIRAAGGAVINYHGEACVNLLNIGGNGQSFGINCSNVTDLGTSAVVGRLADAVVSISSGSGNVTLTNIDKTTAANCVIDNENSITLQDTKLAFYSFGGGANGEKTILTSSRNQPQNLNNVDFKGRKRDRKITISNNYTATINDLIIEVYGDSTVTLPDAVINKDCSIKIINAGGGACSVSTNGTNLIYGEGSQSVSSISISTGVMHTFYASEFGVGRWYFSK